MKRALSAKRMSMLSADSMAPSVVASPAEGNAGASSRAAPRAKGVQMQRIQLSPPRRSQDPMRHVQTLVDGATLSSPAAASRGASVEGTEAPVQMAPRPQQGAEPGPQSSRKSSDRQLRSVPAHFSPGALMRSPPGEICDVPAASESERLQWVRFQTLKSIAMIVVKLVVAVAQHCDKAQSSLYGAKFCAGRARALYGTSCCFSYAVCHLMRPARGLLRSARTSRAMVQFGNLGHAAVGQSCFALPFLCSC